MIIFESKKFFRQIIDLRSFDRFKYGKYIQIIVPIFVSFLFLFVVFTSFLNFIFNDDDDALRAWLSIAPFLGFIMFTIIHWYFLIYRADFYSLIDEVQTLADERIKTLGNYTLYAETQQRVEFLTKILSGALVVPIAALSPFVRVAYHLCIGKYSIDSWFFFVPLWTPFELNSAGCAIITLIVAGACTSTYPLYYMVLCLFIEVAFYTKAFILDIKSIFDRVDRMTKSTTSELSMLESCKEAVDLHNRIYEFMHQFDKATNLIVLVMVGCYVLLICSALFIAEKFSNLVDLQVPVLTIFVALPMIFIPFYFGQKIHSDLMDLSDMIYRSEWYRYPRSVRRFVLLMMMRAQQPLYLSPYGLMRCTLENYLRFYISTWYEFQVMNWIYSAFMVLRGIDEM